MGLLSSSKLSGRIIALLAKQGCQSVFELNSHLKEGKVFVTRQGVHKELRALISQGVVYKIKRSYGLSHVWLSEFNELTESWLHQVLRHSVRTLPTEGNSEKFLFNDLNQMKLFWSHAVLALTSKSCSRELYSWNPHPWFYLSLTQHQMQMMRSLTRSRIAMYKAVGGKSHLDKIPDGLWSQNPRNKARFGINHNDLKDTVYISVLSPYIIQVNVPRSFAKQLNALYHKLDGDITGYAAVLALISKRWRAVVKIKNSPAQCLKVESIFKKVGF